MFVAPIDTDDVDFEALVKRLESDVPADIEAMALNLVARDAGEAMADLERSCREIALALVRHHGATVRTACVLTDGLGRAVVARANAITAAAGANLTGTSQ